MDDSSMTLGLNTGTSLDAVDVGLFCINKNSVTTLEMLSSELPQALVRELESAVLDSELSYARVRYLERQLRPIYEATVRSVLEKAKLSGGSVDCLGVHGQTLHHCPGIGAPYSLQLDAGALLSSRLQMDVVCDFRSMDIALSGQGAPLTPAFARFLCGAHAQPSACFVNLGGIANITWVNEKEQYTTGWDVGPANALMDAWVCYHLGKAYDEAGAWAASGQMNARLLACMLSDSYVKEEPPKSTGRDYFSLKWLERKLSEAGCKALEPCDVQATLAHFTSKLIVEGVRFVSKKASCKCYLHGKGVANEYVKSLLVAELGRDNIATTLALGVHPDSFEVALFAWLAYCYRQGIAVDLTHTTGALRPKILGACYRGS